MASSSPASPNGLGRSFDRAAEEYERGRPGWPAEAINLVARELGLTRANSVLDLGAGTGKLTRLLVERFEHVVAVEPLDALRELLAALVPDADAVAGTAEAIPVGDASVDAVFVAEAFHWFDAKPALGEIARVLRPRGGLVLLWNRPAGRVEPALPDAVREKVNRGFREAKHPMHEYDSGGWRLAFDASAFNELREAAFEHAQVLDAPGMVAYVASMSWIVTLPADEREALLADVRSLLDADEYRRRWRADVYWTRLR